MSQTILTERTTLTWTILYFLPKTKTFGFSSLNIQKNEILKLKAMGDNWDRKLVTERMLRNSR